MSLFFFFFWIGASGFVNLLFYFHIFLYVNVLQESRFYIDGFLLEIVFPGYHFNSKKSMGQTP